VPPPNPGRGLPRFLARHFTVVRRTCPANGFPSGPPPSAPPPGPSPSRHGLGLCAPCSDAKPLPPRWPRPLRRPANRTSPPRPSTAASPRSDRLPQRCPACPSGGVGPDFFSAPPAASRASRRAPPLRLGRCQRRRPASCRHRLDARSQGRVLRSALSATPARTSSAAPRHDGELGPPPSCATATAPHTPPRPLVVGPNDRRPPLPTRPACITPSSPPRSSSSSVPAPATSTHVGTPRRGRPHRPSKTGRGPPVPTPEGALYGRERSPARTAPEPASAGPRGGRPHPRPRAARPDARPGADHGQGSDNAATVRATPRSPSPRELALPIPAPWQARPQPRRMPAPPPLIRPARTFSYATSPFGDAAAREGSLRPPTTLAAAAGRPPPARGPTPSRWILAATCSAERHNRVHYPGSPPATRRDPFARPAIAALPPKAGSPRPRQLRRRPLRPPRARRRGPRRGRRDAHDGRRGARRREWSSRRPRQNPSLHDFRIGPDGFSRMSDGITA
jgi:hypothetical protein